MSATSTGDDGISAFLDAVRRLPQTSAVEPYEALTTAEWAARRRISLCLARRLVREAADEAQLLPDGSKVARLGRTYRIIGA